MLGDLQLPRERRVYSLRTVFNGVAAAAADPADVEVEVVVANRVTAFAAGLIGATLADGSRSSSCAFLPLPSFTGGLHFGSHVARPVVQVPRKDSEQWPLLQGRRRKQRGRRRSRRRGALGFR